MLIRPDQYSMTHAVMRQQKIRATTGLYLATVAVVFLLLPTLEKLQCWK